VAYNRFCPASLLKRGIEIKICPHITKIVLKQASWAGLIICPKWVKKGHGVFLG
jgi:hypothetical protein